MSNKETLQSYNERLETNNTNLDSIMETINNLPEQGAEVEPPELGLVFSKYDEDGFPTKVDVYGAYTVPESAFRGDSYMIMSKRIKELEIHDANATISKNCFYNSGIEKVTALNGSLMGTNVFESSPLKSATLLNRATIPDYTFQNCTSLEEVNIASTKMTKIGNYAFYNCHRLKTIEIPEGVTNTYLYAFNGCSSLNIKTLPDSIKTIDRGLFANCKSLVQMSIKNATTISSSDASTGCFYNCTNLRAVWMPSVSNSFGGHTFSNCTNLKRIYWARTRTQMESNSSALHFWSNNTVHPDCRIICKDDEDYITKEEFDAIDWETYEM